MTNIYEFIIVFDAQYKLIATYGCYAKELKLDTKGDYIICVEIRHDDPAYLESVQNLVMQVDVALSKTLEPQIHSRMENAIGSSKSTFNEKVLDCGDKRAIFITSIESFNMPSEAKPGDLLVGSIDFAGKDIEGMDLSAVYLVPPEAKAKEPIFPAGEPSNKKETEQLQEALRDLKISYIKKIPTGEARNVLITELESACPNHLPFLKEKMEALVTDELLSNELIGATEKPFEGDAEQLWKQVIETAEALIAKAECDKIISFFGATVDASTEAKKKAKKDMERNRDIVGLALARRCYAYHSLLSEARATNATSPSTKNYATKAKQALEELKKWPGQSATDFPRLLAVATAERNEKHFGQALKIVDKWLADLCVEQEQCKRTQICPCSQEEIVD